MDAPQAPQSIPQWVIDWLIWIIVLIAGLLSAAWGWIFSKVYGATRRNRHDIDILKTQMVTKVETKDHQEMVDGLNMSLGEKISRLELVKYMEQNREDDRRAEERADAARKEQREDRRLMHVDNKTEFAVLGTAIASVKDGLDEKFRTVHDRIDKILSSTGASTKS